MGRRSLLPPLDYVPVNKQITRRIKQYTKCFRQCAIMHAGDMACHDCRIWYEIRSTLSLTTTESRQPVSVLHATHKTSISCCRLGKQSRHAGYPSCIWSADVQDVTDRQTDRQRTGSPTNWITLLRHRPPINSCTCLRWPVMLTAVKQCRRLMEAATIPVMWHSSFGNIQD